MTEIPGGALAGGTHTLRRRSYKQARTNSCHKLKRTIWEELCVYLFLFACSKEVDVIDLTSTNKASWLTSV
jgi:hypothetical protein